MKTYLDLSKRVFIIDWNLCKQCHIHNDSWNRQGVTPFTVACYVFHALRTLKKQPEEVYDALMNKWDSLVWRQTPISINLWNKLFSGINLSPDEWNKVLFPSNYIDSIYTCVTSPKVQHECYPMFLGNPKHIPTQLLICTKESYVKTLITKTATKITAYRYGQATENDNVLQGLRTETSKVIIPF